jgi:hypothetical protein
MNTISPDEKTAKMTFRDVFNFLCLLLVCSPILAVLATLLYSVMLAVFHSLSTFARCLVETVENLPLEFWPVFFIACFFCYLLIKYEDKILAWCLIVTDWHSRVTDAIFHNSSANRAHFSALENTHALRLAALENEYAHRLAAAEQANIVAVKNEYRLRLSTAIAEVPYATQKYVAELEFEAEICHHTHVCKSPISVSEENKRLQEEVESLTTNLIAEVESRFIFKRDIQSLHQQVRVLRRDNSNADRRWEKRNKLCEHLWTQLDKLRNQIFCNTPLPRSRKGYPWNRL